MKPSRRIALLIAKSCLVLVAFLALEALARLAHTIRQDVRDYRLRPLEWYRYSSIVHWERQPMFSGRVYGTFREFNSDGFFREDADDVLASDACRILLIGDSCTFAYDVAVSNSFGEVLERQIPSTRVINMGVPGHSSLQGLKLLEAAIPSLKPDIVVISFNYNDRRYTLGPEHGDSIKHFRRSYIAKHIEPRIADGSYLYRALRFAAHKLNRQPEPPSLVEVNSLRPRVSPEAYRDNIQKMAELAHEWGAVPVFLALGDNPKESQNVYDAIALYSEGNLSAAVDELRRCSSITNTFTELARTYLYRASNNELTARTTTPESSTAMTYVPSLHGGLPIETDAVYHEMAKRAASSTAMEYVDATETLNMHPDVFIDMCHFDAAGHSLVAETLAVAVIAIQASADAR